MLFTALMIFHVAVCVLLIIVVLMQSSKGEGLAGGTAFGGSVSGAVFGGRGAASFLSKATTVLAVVFMLNCGILAFMSSSRRAVVNPADVTESVVNRKATEARDQQMQQQQQNAERQARDSANAAGASNPLDEMMGQPADSGGK